MNSNKITKKARIEATVLNNLTPISKARKTLTVNKDAQISVDSLSDDIDIAVKTEAQTKVYHQREIQE